MSSFTGCFCKLCGVLTSPFRYLLLKATYLALTEFFKFLMVLLLVFGIGYAIFYLMNILSNNHEKWNAPIKPERLSAGLIDLGSFTKFPYVVNIPSKTSASSFRLVK